MFDLQAEKYQIKWLLERGCWFMEKVILPLIANPPSVTYQNRANYLGILLTDPGYEKEFYGDYINFIWNNNI